MNPQPFEDLVLKPPSAEKTSASIPGSCAHDPMGIQGLLPFLRSYVKKTHIETFQGTTIGVDAMCWMHKGAYACSRELVVGADTDKFVRFFLRMCEVLRYYKIKPLGVMKCILIPDPKIPKGPKVALDLHDLS